MKEKLEQLFYFGLGTALMAKEKIEQAGESAKELKEENEQKAREFLIRPLPGEAKNVDS